MQEHQIISRMKKAYLFILLFGSSFYLFAQDDLMNMLDEENPQKPTPVYATFKSTRIINLHSNETMKKKHLDFRIQHRFAPVDMSPENWYGLYDMFGLDGAQIRLAMEYGITDKLMIGGGRSTVDKTYDGFLKYKIVEQSRGKKSFPVSIVYFGNMAVNTLKWTDPTRQEFFSSRLSYTNQLIITRKFNDFISLCVSPTLVHYNTVQTKSQPNDIFAIGLGTSIKITRSVRFNIEYIPRINGRDEPAQPDGTPIYYDAFGIGFDFETGGHVFQIHFTNATGMIEQYFIARNTSPTNFSQVRFGFNLSRTFSFDHSKK